MKWPGGHYVLILIIIRASVPAQKQSVLTVDDECHFFSNHVHQCSAMHASTRIGKR